MPGCALLDRHQRDSFCPLRSNGRNVTTTNTFEEVTMPKSKAAGLTRRQMLKVGGAATFAGYAVGVEKANSTVGMRCLKTSLPISPTFAL